MNQKKRQRRIIAIRTIGGLAVVLFAVSLFLQAARFDRVQFIRVEASVIDRTFHAGGIGRFFNRPDFYTLTCEYQFAGNLIRSQPFGSQRLRAQKGEKTTIFVDRRNPKLSYAGQPDWSWTAAALFSLLAAAVLMLVEVVYRTWTKESEKVCQHNGCG